jgi:hypothetical protein
VDLAIVSLLGTSLILTMAADSDSYAPSSSSLLSLNSTLKFLAISFHFNCPDDEREREGREGADHTS